MSQTTTDRPAKPAGQVEWVSLTEATRITGSTRSSVYKLAVSGRVRTRVRPGELAKYHRDDLVAAAAEA
jgi:hypothetical protein